MCQGQKFTRQCGPHLCWHGIRYMMTWPHTNPILWTQPQALNATLFYQITKRVEEVFHCSQTHKRSHGLYWLSFSLSIILYFIFTLFLTTSNFIMMHIPIYNFVVSYFRLICFWNSNSCRTTKKFLNERKNNHLDLGIDRMVDPLGVFELPITFF